MILDGYVVCAAAAILHALDPATLDHCLAGHVSAEGAHSEVLRRLGKNAVCWILGCGLAKVPARLLAFGIIKAAMACHTGMATFEEAEGFK